ncbi:MAG: hypothetical protein WDW36_009266 [Sanguina aurantia]
MADNPPCYSNRAQVKSILKPSPSLLYNNLAVAGDMLLYVHVRQACMLSSASVKAPVAPATATLGVVTKIDSTPHSDVIHTLRTCSFNESTYIVMATDAGLQVYEKGGTQLLFAWAFPAPQTSSASMPTSPSAASSSPTTAEDPSPTPATFARGVTINIANDGAANILFGGSDGRLYVVQVGEDGKFSQPLGFSLDPAHLTGAATAGLVGSLPVTAMSSAFQSRRGRWAEDLGCEVVVSDEGGWLHVWQGHSSGNYQHVRSIAPDPAARGMPVVSVAVRRDFIIAGRLDGRVLVHGLRTLAPRSDALTATGNRLQPVLSNGETASPAPGLRRHPVEDHLAAPGTAPREPRAVN